MIGGISLHLTRGHVLFFAFLVILAGLFSYFFYRRRPSGATGRDWPLALLRGVGLSLLVLALFEPFLGLLLKVRQRPLVAVLVDASSSMSIEDEAPNRLKAASGVFEKTLRPSLGERAQVVLFGFSSELEMEPESLAAEGKVTDIGAAIRDLPKILGRQPSAAVLLSDGNSNVGERPIDAATDAGFPLYTVGVGDASAKRDVALKGIRTNDIAYAGDVVPAEVPVESKGFEGEKTLVSLYEGGRLLDRKEIVLSGERQEQSVEFEVNPGTPGMHAYRVMVDALKDELSAENNSRTFAVQVLKSKINILLIGRPSWDAKFLLESCLEDENVSMHQILHLGGSKYLMKEETREGPGTLPSNRGELLAYDAVVIHSPGSGQITDGFGQLISDFVSSDGRGLLFLGDVSGVPGSLESLLPVLTSGELKKAVKCEPTGAGLTHPSTSLADDLHENETLWKGLPPVYVENRAVGLRALATALAVDPGTKTAQGEMPVVAIQTFGRGKTMCILSAETWKWSFMPVGLGKSSDAYSRLYSNIWRWLVARQEMDRLRVRTDRSVYLSGEEVSFLAQFYDENYRPDDGAEVRLRVDAGEPLEILLAPMGNGRYEGTLDALPPGRYMYRAIAYKEGQRMAEARGDLAVEEATLEFMETRMQESELTAVAEASGGRYYPLSRASALADEIVLEPAMEKSRLEFDLKTSPLMFVAAVLIFASEWVWRKRRGLP